MKPRCEEQIEILLNDLRSYILDEISKKTYRDKRPQFNLVCALQLIDEALEIEPKYCWRKEDGHIQD